MKKVNWDWSYVQSGAYFVCKYASEDYWTINYANRQTVPYFHSCREVFHRNLKTSKNKKSNWFIAITGRNGYWSNVINFISALEDHVGVDEKCQFVPTEQSHIYYVVPGKWWRQQHIRLSLLTLLIREGYTEPDFSEWHRKLKKHQPAGFVGCTKTAILKFIDGYTKINNRCSMWVSAFGNEKSRLKNLKHLVKP